ncbi:hypothetical protein M409DRAFT_60086 [Zasmidium cellare ATCC 36951]|uniref:G-patch domain-containing protein n=1 Tax=Zasmidium cellare ATCC 36951 TaxID=1080233 RepID=A0A6A6C4T6_ZASCE|nr:uncharacterized protein M409DRAFT_60086 [Zasmidium cellare ATCC 36951]KAF2160396.1 hypothetical protein M409DRAFT_60086 [Zasmidium cellare ATCC 36951]
MAEPPKKRGLTLYGDLITPETRAEVEARDAKALAEEKKKKKDASLMFKPTNLGKKNGKPAQKPKPTFASMHKPSSSTSTGTAPPTASSPDAPTQQLSSEPQDHPPPPPPQKRGFNDWLADEEQEQEYYERRPRWQSKKAKKQQQQYQEQWSWTDTYDPSQPVPYEQYSGSDHWRDTNSDWRERLHVARDQHRGQASGYGGYQGGYNGGYSNMDGQGYNSNMGSRPPPNMQFASPPSFAPPQSFAPPATYSPDPVSRSNSLGPSSGRNSGFSNRYDDNGRPPLPPVDLNKDESGDDAYARRMALSAQPPPPPPPATRPPMPQANAPSSRAPLSAADQEKRAKAEQQIAAMKAKLAAAKASSASPAPPPAAASTPPPPPPPPPPTTDPPKSATVISAPPTYNPEYLAQKAQQERQQSLGNDKSFSDAADDAHEPQSKAPGQAGFAQRVMERMGYEKGKGLGASGEGITSALSVKADKRKKKPDAQGGGYVAPAAMGKIMGGKTKKKADGDEDGPHGKMSAVVKFEGMLKDMDVDKAIQDEGILQEIGDEMAEFGKVERLKIWRSYEGGNDEVFIKFTSQLSALRAINAMDGAEFEGNTIQARYWDDEKFEAGEYA